MKSIKQRCLAWMLTLVMVVTLMPAQTLMVMAASDDVAEEAVVTPDEAAQDTVISDMDVVTSDVEETVSAENGLIAEFTFDNETDGLKAGGATATVVGDVDFTQAGVMNNGAYFSGSGQYLTVANDDGSSLLAGKDVITVSYFSKPGTAGNGWTFYAAPNDNTQTYPNEHYVGVIDKPGSLEIERYNNSGSRPGTVKASGVSKDWKLVTIVMEETTTTLYVNGVKTAERTGEYKLTDILGDGGILYFGRANWVSGEYYNGYIDDLKIYDRALEESEILAAYEEGADALDAKVIADLAESLPDELASEMLAKNASLDFVSTDLSFPATLNGADLVWTSSNTDVVAADGKVAAVDADTQVDITVAATYHGKPVVTKTYTVSVKNPLQADYDSLIIPDQDNIRGNITLPTTGDNGSAITWKSSNPSVISDTAVTNEGYADTPAGVVERQSTDTAVTLTATIAKDGMELEKVFEVTVKAAVEMAETTDYIFAYFTANTIPGEKIYFASSRDGMGWEELNDAEPVLESTMGTQGLRDPFIIRSAEGDKFYLIATDLSIGRDGNWTTAQQKGSQAIMVWESDDLVNWSDQRMVTISDTIGAGCTWAPEAYYDDITGEYVVFWASKVSSDNYGKQRVYYCKTRDFRTFTDPEVWIDRTVSTIDTTVVAGNDGYLYRISKNEGSGTLADGESVTGSTCYIERAESLFGTWTKLTSTSLKSDIGGVEGPCCFQLNDDDVDVDTWCLLLDHFGSGGYRAYTSTNLGADDVVFTAANASLPSAPRHGTVMPITTEEYETLMAAYGDVKVSNESVPSTIVANSGYTLPDTVTVTFAGEDSQVNIVWSTTAEELNTPGTLTVKGTIPSMNNLEVTKTVTILSDKLIYYIDAGVGNWNEKLQTSSVYMSVAEYIGLRNKTPDAFYTEGSWGYVNDEANLTTSGNHTSTTDDLYSNGWWARGNEDCEYILPLESGTYSATSYYTEWWNVTRPMNFYVTYINDAGETVKSDVNSVTISSSVLRTTSTLEFTVEGVADTTEVHLITEKGGSSDPVISGLSVEKLDGGSNLRVPMTSIKMDNKDAMPVIREGETYQMKAVAEPADTTDGILWSSSNPDIATVDANGLVTAVAYGSEAVVITAYSSVDSSLSDTNYVIVEPNYEARAQADLNAISLPTTTKRSSLTLTAKGSRGSVITWASSNPAVIAEDGTVTRGLEDVTVTLTATVSSVLDTDLDTPATKEFTIVVEADTDKIAEALASDLAAVTLPASTSKNLTLPAAGASGSEITWTTSNDKVITAEGIVTVPNDDTEVTLTATAVLNGVSESKEFKVTVTGNHATEIKAAEKSLTYAKVTPTKKTLYTKKVTHTVTLKITYPSKFSAKLKAAGLTVKSVKYTSSNKKIATVSSKGKVTGVKAGTATIKTVITLSNGTKKTLSTKITVKKPYLKISGKTSVKVGKSIKLKVKKYGVTGTAKWSVDKKSIATINSKTGKLTAKKKGTVKVTVKVGTVKKTYKVKVK